MTHTFTDETLKVFHQENIKRLQFIGGEMLGIGTLSAVAFGLWLVADTADERWISFWLHVSIGVIVIAVLVGLRHMMHSIYCLARRLLARI